MFKEIITFKVVLVNYEIFRHLEPWGRILDSTGRNGFGISTIITNEEFIVN